MAANLPGSVVLQRRMAGYLGSSYFHSVWKCYILYAIHGVLSSDSVDLERSQVNQFFHCRIQAYIRSRFLFTRGGCSYLFAGLQPAALKILLQTICKNWIERVDGRFGLSSEFAVYIIEKNVRYKRYQECRQHSLVMLTSFFSKFLEICEHRR